MTAVLGEQDTPVQQQVRTGPVSFSLTADWTRVQSDQVDALYVAPRGRRGSFRANIAVTVRPAQGDPSDRVQRLIDVAAHGGPVLAVEPLAQGGPTGRRLESLYAAEEGVVRATVWAATTAAGEQVEVTASRALVAPAAVHAAIVLAGSSLLIEAVDRQDVDIDLRIPEPAPWPAQAFPGISDDAWAALWRSLGHGFQPQLARTPPGIELRDAGLLNRFGGTTPEAEVLLRTARAGARSTVRRTGSDGDEIWSSWTAFGAVTSDRGEIAGDPPAVARHHLLHSDRSTAIALLLEWLGMRATTAWGHAEKADVPAASIDRRIRGADPVPDAAGPALSAAWRSGVWNRYELQAVGAPATLVVLRSGDGTWWHEGPADADGQRPVRAISTWYLIDLVAGGIPG